MAHPALMDTKVQVGFGYTPYSTSVTWTDISDYVDVRSGGAVMTARTGRSGTSGITPGTLSLTLENLDGRFNPRNTAGPYYGNLKNGVPVRVVCTVDGTPITRWQGFVSGGWPQDLVSFAQTVQLECHDLFGLLSQGPTPESAFAMAVSSLSVQPDQWWRPGDGEWIDRKSGVRGAVTGEKLVSTDALVDGDPSTFGQLTSGGIAQIDDLSKFPDITNVTNFKVMSLWFRTVAPADRTLDVSGTDFVNLFHFPSSSSNWNASEGGARLVFIDGTFTFQLFTRTGWVSAFTDGNQPANVNEGAVHNVTVRWRDYTDAVSLWLDGVELPLFGGGVAWGAAATPTRKPALIGHSVASSGNGVPVQGTIDHVLMWGNDTRTYAQVYADQAALYTAGRIALAGQRLDERVTSVISALGLSHYLGTLDSSVIVTQQGYRSGDIIQLLQQIEDTEQGRVWVDQAGVLQFSKRSWAWDDSVSNTLQYTFTDVGATIDAGTGIEMLSGGTVIADDPLKVSNVARVTSTYGRQQTAENATSIAAYGRRNPVTLSGLLHSSDRQSQAIAEWLVYSRGTSAVNAERVTFDVDVQYTASKYAASIARPGVLVQVIKQPPIDSSGSPIGPTVTVDAHIVGITHSWSWAGLTVAFDLDATRAGRSFFKWGTSTWGGSDAWAY